MKLTRAFSLCLALAVTPFVGVASAASESGDQLKQKLSDTLGIEVISMADSPIPDLYQVITNRGVLYVSKDGSKLLHGNLYDLNQDMKNLTEAALAGPRLEMLKPFEDEMLVYKAKNEKHVVTVFTDVTCGYCRKLHSQMQQYNDLGITVRYLAYPRQGVPSPNAEEMEAIWCAKDPQQAMTDAKAGKGVKMAKCDANITGQHQLGMKMGISGTPALILENGTLIPGYQAPRELLYNLERAKQ